MFSKILKYIWPRLSKEERERIIKFLEKSCNYFNFSQLVAISRSNIVEVRGGKMFIDPKRNPALALYDIGGYENAVGELFESHLKEGDVVVDIGTNIGYCTLIAARLIGKSGRVYAFEPDPINFSFFKRNVEINNYENVIREQKAVSNKGGKIKLFLSGPNRYQTGSYTIVGKGNKYVEVETVKIGRVF